MSRWAAAWNAMQAGDTVDTVDTVALARGAAGGVPWHSVNSVNSVTGSETGIDHTQPLLRAHSVNSVTPLADQGCDARHIAAEPALPPRGTPDRDRLDRRHAETVRGLLDMAMQRPVSWADPAALPSAGCWCSCCQGRSWWSERTEPKGWRCSTCHPPTGIDDMREVRT